jgi:hypothetical protein
MTNTPFKALLVEGTSGVGKSTLIDALIRRHVADAPSRKIRTLVHLAQSHTYGPLATPEDRGTLTVSENLLHLERIVSHLEWLHASVQEHAKPWCFVVVDTLHMTHCVRPGIVGWNDVAPLDQRLAAIGCKLLFLKASATALWERGILPRQNEQFIREYARKFGATHEEIHRHFVKEQESLVSLFERSCMTKLLLDSEDTPEIILDQAFRFWTDATTPSQPSALQVTRIGCFTLPCSPDQAFPLFSPEGEHLWIKTWNPQPVYPSTIEFRRDTVFREAEAYGEALWTILDADFITHRAEYVRHAPGSHAAHIVVKLDPAPEGCQVTIRYILTAFGSRGNEMLASFSEAAYAEKMHNWQHWIADYLACSIEH